MLFRPLRRVFLALPPDENGWGRVEGEAVALAD